MLLLGEWDHPQSCAAALVATDNGAATVGNGAADFCEGDSASGIAHGDDGEEGM